MLTGSIKSLVAKTPSPVLFPCCSRASESVAVDRRSFYCAFRPGHQAPTGPQPRCACPNPRESDEWGDFRGNPVTLAEQYFYAHSYFATWGSRRLILRAPTALVSLDVVLPYCREDALSVHRHGVHTVIKMVGEDDADDEEGDGILAELIGVHEELCRGDLRALALARRAGETPEPKPCEGGDCFPGSLSAAQPSTGRPVIPNLGGVRQRLPDRAGRHRGSRRSPSADPPPPFCTLLCTL